MEFPPELLAKPSALIGLSGLDLTNTIHRSIWDAFHNHRRCDNVSVQFKHLSLSPTFPTPKPKRNLYEWYIPKGILKRNWMPKYLSEVPSVIACFYELDWMDTNWTEKKMECALRVQAIRSALEGRAIRIAVVLVQKTYVVTPDSEDNVITEKATALCAACEIPRKNLCVLPLGDHLLGYTSRLESAFYELAQSFYHQQYRTVKGHKDQLNKISHQYLFVRHQFKMAFLNELRQDKLAAIKHYQTAYSNLLEIRMVDTNTFEVKTVAAFINYKICRLMFALSQPRDAISQFRTHTDRFKSRTGPEDLIFEHHAFMTNQYSSFADLFDDAIRQGLPALQTQHPGYYYQTAATQAGLRQIACADLCSGAAQVVPDPLAEESKVEFYGQRSWRPGKLSAEPADVAQETQGIQALKWREKNVNHSVIIIGLLGNAMSQFKIYKCPRMRRLLAVQMAGEYFNSKDYGKVLTLLTHMLWEYRTERWPLLLTDVLDNGIKAAFLNASIQDYLTLSIEGIGPTTIFETSQKMRIYSNLRGILNGKVPEPEPGLSQEAVDEARKKWTIELDKNDKFLTTIEDPNIMTFLQVKGSFRGSSFIVGEPLGAEVIIKNLFDGILDFSKISVNFSCSVMPDATLVAEVDGDMSGIESGEMKRFTCALTTPHVADGTEIQISAVSLMWGTEQRGVVLKLPPNPGASLEIRSSKGSFEEIKVTSAAVIKVREAPVDIAISSNRPALLSEWLPLNLAVTSQEVITEISVQIKNAQEHGGESFTELSRTMSGKESSIVFKTDRVSPEQSFQGIIYVRSHQPGTRSFLVRCEFLGADLMKRIKDVTYTIDIVKPFDVTTQFYSKSFEPVTKVFVDDSFILMPHIVSSSPWPLRIIETSLEFGSSINLENSPEGLLKDCLLTEEEAATDVYCVVPTVSSAQPTSIGIYTIKWRREDQDGICTSTSVTLAPIWVEDAPVGIEAAIPSHGYVRTPMCVTYYLQNKSDYLITLNMTMEANDAFMFAGQKQVNVYLRPRNSKKLQWILRPLVAGLVALPALKFSVPPEEEHKISKSRLIEILDRSLPTHVYIMPKSLTSEELLG